jgi:hypothetical protein
MASFRALLHPSLYRLTHIHFFGFTFSSFYHPSFKKSRFISPILSSSFCPGLSNSQDTQQLQSAYVSWRKSKEFSSAYRPDHAGIHD